METFLFSFNAVMPLILMVALGFFLARIKLIDSSFIEKANKFCFKRRLSAQLVQHNCQY